MEKALASAVDVIERKIQLLERGGWFADLHKRRRAIDHLLPTIRATSDAVTRDMYLGRVSEATGVDRHVLTTEAEAPEGGERSTGQRAGPGSSCSPASSKRSHRSPRPSPGGATRGRRPSATWFS